MRRPQRFPLPLAAAGLFLLILVILLIRVVPLFFSTSAEEVVNEFYTYEQEGDFGSSWQLFHPVMHERFPKNAYVTERSHIYMSHYGITTFSFKILKQEKINTWKSADKIFNDVEKFQVKQTFKSKFGVFSVVQHVYAVKEKDEWKLLWEFKE